MIDRKVPPILHESPQIGWIQPEEIAVNPLTPSFWMTQGCNEAFKLDLELQYGSIHDDVLVAKTAVGLLLAGTKNKTAAEIHNAIDLLGGFTALEVGAESATLSLYGMVEHFDQLTATWIDAIINAVYPEKELTDYLQTKKQKFQVNAQKVATLARRKFLTSIYAGTPFERVTTLKDFETVTQEKVIRFHKNNILKSLRLVSAIGAISDQQKKHFLQCVQPLARLEKVAAVTDFPETQAARYHEVKEGAVQSALRIGRTLFNRNHPDYPKFQFLNTILGGYFGSRLMTVLREEKGFTYGVGSGVAQSIKSGYFFIATEVGTAHQDAAIDVIFQEIEKLQTTLCAHEEIAMVRNYNVGQLLQGSDGPFAMMDRFLSVYRFGLDFSYYDQLLTTWQEIQAVDIQQMAKKYLSSENLVVVSAGS